MIRDTYKLLSYGFLQVLGAYKYFRYRNRDKPIVLTYHGILPEISADELNYEFRNFVTVRQFEDQIRFLLKKYKPLRVSDFYNGNNSKLNRGFLITFDDGFRNNYSYALPILQKYGLEGVFFITTNFIGSREFLWTEQVTRLIQKTQKKSLEVDLGEIGRGFQLPTIPDKEHASQEIRNYLKLQPPSVRNKILEEMKTQLDDVELTIDEENEERYLFMNWEEVKEMSKRGQIIGSHTHTHPMLSTLGEEESLEELRLSKEAVENHTNEPCDVMSYPNGEKSDYSSIQKEQLRTLGYKCAFTQVSPFVDYQTDRYELNRYNISLKMERYIFEAKISGFR
jgi:peptidoglycan/xylan/chitin deacetylase (PgdA/CDA1 family)